MGTTGKLKRTSTISWAFMVLITGLSSCSLNRSPIPAEARGIDAEAPDAGFDAPAPADSGIDVAPDAILDSSFDAGDLGVEDAALLDAVVDTAIDTDPPPRCRDVCEGTCMGEKCIMNCSDIDCESGVDCPAGIECEVDCREADCAAVNCSLSDGCTVHCRGDNCEQEILCSERGVCDINCQSGACNGPITCGGNCDVDCSTDGCTGPITCRNAERCHVRCDSASTCS